MRSAVPSPRSVFPSPCILSNKDVTSTKFLSFTYTLTHYFIQHSTRCLLLSCQTSKKPPAFKIPSSKFLAATMQMQQNRSKQPPTSFHPSNPTMDRNPSFRYGNPLTFNVAVMFLFYILSVSLCLSSFSTCICVIFNPVGTIRTITNYLFYALGLSILLTLLFVALTGVCFDNEASPESQSVQEIVGETLVPEEVPASQDVSDAASIQEAHHEVSAAQQTVDATPIQEAYREGSAPHGVLETTLTQKAYREVSVQPTPRLSDCAALLAHQAECERLRRAFRPPSIEAQATAIHRLTDTDTGIANPAARDDGAPPSTSAASTSQQTALEDDHKKGQIAIAKTVDGIPRFCEEILASPEEMSDAGEQNENALKARAVNHTEAAGQTKAADNVITARESKKIEKWIIRTNLANTHTVKACCGTLKGVDANDVDIDEEIPEIMVERCNDGGALSETRSLSPDSSFQKALRGYMGKRLDHGGRQSRSGNSTPGLGLSEESEFQGWVREMFTLEKVGKRKAGEKRRARSA